MAPRKQGSLDYDELFIFGVPTLFTIFMLIVMAPLLVNEPYGRVLVNARLDTGSRLFQLLFPGGLFAIFVLVGIGSTFYFLLSSAKKYPAFNDFWNRLLPTSNSKV